jgi:hypothetical protein
VALGVLPVIQVEAANDGFHLRRATIGRKRLHAQVFCTIRPSTLIVMSPRRIGTSPHITFSLPLKWTK